MAQHEPGASGEVEQRSVVEGLGLRTWGAPSQKWSIKRIKNTVQDLGNGCTFGKMSAWNNWLGSLSSQVFAAFLLVATGLGFFYYTAWIFLLPFWSPEDWHGQADHGRPQHGMFFSL